MSPGVVGSAAPQTSANPYYFQEGATLAEMDHGYYAGVSGWYFTITLATSPYATGYEFNGRSNTGDWYQAIVGDNWPGCNAGFEMLYSDWNAAGSNLGTSCDPNVGAMSAGDSVALDIYVATTSPYQVCMEVYDYATLGASTDCVNQPDPGSTPQNNYMEMMGTAADSHGYFTGPMTEVVDTTAASCLSYTSLPAMTYQWASGSHITEYIPWSDEFQSGMSTCYINDGPLQVLAPADNNAHYYQSTGPYGYGPHWEAVTNISNVNVNYYWQVCTDCTPATPIVPSISGPTGGDVSQALSYTPSASGGSPSGYYWYLNDVYQTATTGAWVWTPASAGTYTIYALAYDAAANRYGPSNVITVTVSPALTIGAPTASPVSPSDLGQTITFTSAVPSGGLSPYGYSWTSLPTGCTNSLTSTDSCSPSASSTYTVTVKVTDGNGATASGSITYVVNPALVAGPITPASPTIDSGQFLLLTSHPAGGTTPYSAYQWFTGTACGTAITGATGSTYNANPASTTSYSYKVTDSASSPVSVCSAVDTVSVNLALTNPALSPTSESIDSGQSVSFSASWTGGTASFTAKLDTSTSSSSCTGLVVVQAVASASSPQAFTAVAPTSTTYYCATITDSSAAGSVTTTTGTPVVITVNAALSVPALSPGSESIDSGQSVTFSASWSGGTSAFTAKLDTSTSSSSCTGLVTVQTVPSATSPQSFTAVSPASTTYYCATVTDSSGSGAVTTTTASPVVITVNAALVAGIPTPTSVTIDAGQTKVLTNAATGGTSPFTWQWYDPTTSLTCSATSPAIGGATSSTYTTPNTLSAGTYYFCYRVTDSSAAGAVSVYSSTDTVVVNAVLTTPTLSPGSESIDSGQSVSFSTTWSGGTSSFTAKLDTSTSSASCTGLVLVQSITSAVSPQSFTAVSPTSTTYYCASITDSSGAGAVTTTTTTPVVITVNAALSAPTLSPGSETIDNGQSVSFSASWTGGTASFTAKLDTSTSSSSCTGLVVVQTVGSASSPQVFTAVAPTSTTYYCASITDSSGAGAVTTTTASPVVITVNSALGVPTLSPGSQTIDSGQSVTFSVSWTGGTSSFTAKLDTSTSSSTCTGLAVVQTIGSASSPQTFTAVAPTSTTYYCSTITDSSGAGAVTTTTSSPVVITVNAALSAPTLSPGSEAIDSGQSVAFSESWAGGTSSFTAKLDTSTSSASCTGLVVVQTIAPASSPQAFTAVAPTSTTYYCSTITDSSGAGAVTTTTASPVVITVNAALAAAVPTPTSVAIDAGQTEVLTNAATGGTSPFTWQWYDPTTSGTCSATSPAIGGATSPTYTTPNTLSAGTYYFCYRVTDSSAAGAVSVYSSTDTVVVNA
ncbi:MAG: hypothetical protein KGI89_10700, partial [Euryarchaeota archaeon]|nr:hypothetical protein [Euryarchaeota archaeon]